MAVGRLLPGLLSAQAALQAAAAQASTDATCDVGGQCREIGKSAASLPREQVLMQRYLTEHKVAQNSTDTKSLRTTAAAMSLTSSEMQLFDSEAASHMQVLSRDASNVAGVLQKCMSALLASTTHFTAQPPRVVDGITELGKGLLEPVEMLVPDGLQKNDVFQKFKTAWADVFVRIPEAFKSIKEDIELYIETGEGQYLVRAISSILEEAVLVVNNWLPQNTAMEINKYLDSFADMVDAMGASWGDFTDGKTVDGVESIYWGLRSVTDSLLPDSVKSEEAYDTIVSGLDLVLGSLSKHVLEYERLIMESSVCWRVEKSRERKRPEVCPNEYVWDGAAECYPTSELPTTTASANIRDDYEHFKKGSCRGSHVFDNPRQYKVEGFKGSLESCMELCSQNPKCLAAEYKSDKHCETWEEEPTTTWRLSFNKACYKRKNPPADAGRPIPARCGEDFTDKQGHYCYASCPAGSEVKESSQHKCVSACTGDFPAESRLMCGKSTGMLAKAVLEMVTVVLNSAFSVADNIKKMHEHGVKGELLTDTIQTFIDMGRPFANPMCGAN